MTTTEAALTSERLVLDEGEVFEEFSARGWTDGLPIVAPTPARVSAMLAAGGASPGDVLGTVLQSGIVAHAEDLAVNAVMAGCRPEYFPLLRTAAEAILTPEFNIHLALTSTGGPAFAIVVSGPLAGTLGLNNRRNLFGPGNRPNSTIGRALRLFADNALNRGDRSVDGASFANSGRYSLCFAEDEPIGWDLLRVSLGYDVSDTIVVALSSEAPRAVGNHLNGNAAGVLRTMAAAMRNPSIFSVGKGAQGILVLGPEHAAAVIDAGWSRRAVQEHLVDQARVWPSELQDAGVLLEGNGSQHDMTPGPDGRLPTFRSPDDLVVVTAGGRGAGWSAYINGLAPTIHSTMVVRAVGAAGQRQGTGG